MERHNCRSIVGECDGIFSLSLFTHLSTKMKIQQPIPQPRSAESRSVRLQRWTAVFLPPLGEPRLPGEGVVTVPNRDSAPHPATVAPPAHRRSRP